MVFYIECNIPALSCDFLVNNIELLHVIWHCFIFEAMCFVLQWDQTNFKSCRWSC